MFKEETIIIVLNAKIRKRSLSGIFYFSADTEDEVQSLNTSSPLFPFPQK